jgi:hypothetical protein
MILMDDSVVVSLMRVNHPLSLLSVSTAKIAHQATYFRQIPTYPPFYTTSSPVSLALSISPPRKHGGRPLRCHETGWMLPYQRPLENTLQVFEQATLRLSE